MVLAAALAVAGAAVAAGPDAGCSPPAQATAALFPVPSPRDRADRHLATARELLAGSCRLAEDCPARSMEGFHAAAGEAWNAVWTCPGAPDVLAAAMPLYNDALAGLLGTAAALCRLDGTGLTVGPDTAPRHIPVEIRGLALDPARLRAVVVRPPAADKRVSRSHVRPGFGLPVSLRLTPEDPRFAPPRRSVAATAVLRFPLPGEPNMLRDFVGPLGRDPAPAVLDLADPVEVAAVRIGPARPLLAADLTAPLLDMLAATPPAGIEGFLQPYGRSDTQPRLEQLESHRRGRIPVVFIHGLASDPGTWFDIINELRTWPDFHRRFEPWLFQYPTGATFLQSAAVLRRELAVARTALDPAGTDPGLDRMVLVGHSMGGLHAKLQVVDPGTALWDAMSTRPFAAVRMPAAVRANLVANYFFRPTPFVRRVVFIATPHAGSSLASRAVGRVASVTVRQPPETLRLHQIIREANPDAIRPQYLQRPPTTIDVLEPDSTILRAIRDLRPPCWISLHTIIGNAAVSPVEGPGDAVVSVGSARHAGVVSELEVPAIHTRVHHHPRTVLELRRILECHLVESGAPPTLVAAPSGSPLPAGATGPGEAERLPPPPTPLAAAEEGPTQWFLDPVARTADRPDRRLDGLGPVDGGAPLPPAGASESLGAGVSAPLEAHRWSAVSLPRR
jgi:pimeloyl-ACP methyl ester carboxylesterase